MTRRLTIDAGLVLNFDDSFFHLLVVHHLKLRSDLHVDKIIIL